MTRTPNSDMGSKGSLLGMEKGPREVHRWGWDGKGAAATAGGAWLPPPARPSPPLPKAAEKAAASTSFFSSSELAANSAIMGGVSISSPSHGEGIGSDGEDMARPSLSLFLSLSLSLSLSPSRLNITSSYYKTQAEGRKTCKFNYLVRFQLLLASSSKLSARVL